MSEQTLLIVEDDLALQRQLRWAYDGYRVIVAGTREEAVALAMLAQRRAEVICFSSWPSMALTAQPAALKRAS